jgi:hypothetical protein
VEKEWLSFGHKFAQRHGHGTFSPKFKDTQRAPIFLQFVDCCWQLMQQFPTSFELNERALLSVVDACYSCLFGTFLCNTDQERRVLYKVADGTVSLWSYLLNNRKVFSNPMFDASSRLRLFPKLAPAQMQVWRTLYCRYQWLSVNELVGLPMNTPDLSVLSINCMRLERALVELARTQQLQQQHQQQQQQVQPPPPAIPPNKPALSPLSKRSPPMVRLGVEAPTRMNRSGSVTMDEIEGSRKRWQSLDMVAVAEDPRESIDKEEDDEEEEEDDDDEKKMSGAKDHIVSAPALSGSNGAVLLLNPRRDMSKRRGVKLDANEILEMEKNNKQ